MNLEQQQDENESPMETDIAIVGMAGRWPRAKSPNELWRNYRDGVDCIDRFPESEIEADYSKGQSTASDYIRARSILEDIEYFDAGFFGILPSEAELLDPQFRVFLECCWEALEDAGYDPNAYEGSIGVIAGCALNTYLLRNVCSDRDRIEKFTGAYPLGEYAVMLGAMADTLTSRVSYKLNLRGPSFTLLTACSTSLVAVAQACQSLLNYQCDMILSGGVAITLPQKRGHTYQEGGMGTADGFCRPFEARASGTVFGSGAGVVLLKRLGDAIKDGDHIHAIIKGFAVNNDGSTKVGYTAPSVEGQAEAISQALEFAGVSPQSIGYLEAHGTATPLGDPIEFTALNKAFRQNGATDNQFCAIGSIKRYIGHIEMAAGVSGLISAACALRDQQIPPMADFLSPNPNINFSSSPFYVNQQLKPWPSNSSPRRAGVSSFGLGGTNAHIVMQEAPTTEPSVTRSAQLLVLSARSESALDKATENLAEHLRKNPSVDLASVAYTLQVGRRAFEHRRTAVCSDTAEAIRVLESKDRNRVQTKKAPGGSPSVVFMFPGQGSQYPQMGRGLYEFDPGFKSDIDSCAEILKPYLNLDLRDVLTSHQSNPIDIKQTSLAQPALFVLGYATARMWERWGINPHAMVGHSVGEFVAAHLAGVFSLKDALVLVATRGRMSQELPPGAMLSVRLGHQDVLPWITQDLSLAAVNGPQLSVVAGPFEAIEVLERKLADAGVAAMRLATSHAFHSSMMDPVIGPFTNLVKGIRLSPPNRPFVSSVTGDWITPDQATDPHYWSRHMREAVLFSKCVELLRSKPNCILLECGPGSVLCKLTRQHRDSSGAIAVSSLPDSAGEQTDVATILNAAGSLWLNGMTPNWKAMHAGTPRRCSLPTYPFERQRHWVDPPPRNLGTIPNGALSKPEIIDTAETCVTAPQENNMSQMKPVPSRTEKIRSEIIDVLESLSGMDLTEVEPSVSFLEMGFDSLFLTQVTQVLMNRLNVKVTFRQLLDQYPSPEALAEYLDGKLPPDAFNSEPASTAVPTSVPAPAVANGMPTPTAQIVPQVATLAPMMSAEPTPSSSAVESVIRTQLQVMQQLMSTQLDLLRGGVALPVATTPHPVVQAPVASPPAPVVEVTQPKSAPEAGSTEKQEFKAHGRFKPIQRGAVGTLSNQQLDHIKALTARWNSKTKGSKNLAQKRRKVLADPRTASGFRLQWKEMVYPISVVRSKGSRLWDVDGNEYIDIVNGFGPILFGHAPDFVTDAVTNQLQLGFETGPSTPLAGECADLICELTGNERTTFCNTGSEAVMAAMRLARTVTGRNKIVMFTNDYHGTFDEVLVKGIQRQGAPYSLPVAPGICNEAVSNVIVLDYGASESLEFIRKNIRDVAAVMVEPVQSRHPELQPVEFLREVRKITEDGGAALIFDEVVTGFRTHPGGIQALFGIRADLATYGKVAGGGMPIGILSGKAKFMDALDGGDWQFGDDSVPEVGVTFFAGTFVRHPIAMAATLAVLRKLKESGPALQRELGERVAKLAGRVNDIFNEVGVPSRAEHFSSWFSFGFGSEQPYGSLLYYHLREKGIFVLEGFPCFLTTAHTDADVAAIEQAFRESAVEMKSGGFFADVQASTKSVPTPFQTIELPVEVPLTEPQVEVLLAARLGDDANASFNEGLMLRFNGQLNQGALQDSLTTLIARHDSLRATIIEGADRLRVLEPTAVELPLIDLSAKAEKESAADLQAMIRADAATPFDLVNGPIFRMKLVRLAEDRHVLLFTSHHIVFDGWSANVLLGELATLYSARVSNTPASLPPAPSFRKYAIDQNRWKGTSERSDIENWWVSKFQTAVLPLELPTDRPRAAVKSFAGNTAKKTIGLESYQRIKKFGAQQGCTLFATLLTGFNALVHRLCGQNDIVVGIPAAGQSTLDDGALVGHCVNFLPLRTSFDGDPIISSLMKQVRGTLLDAYDHQNYTFGSLVQKLGIRRDPSRLPLVEIQFNLEKFGGGLNFSGLIAEADTCPKAFVNFDLFLNVVESANGLVLALDYNTDLFDEPTVDRWLGHFETLLLNMAEDASKPVSTVSLMNAGEVRQLTIEWNDTSRDYPRDLCTHQLIETQSARTPDSVAVVAADKQLTYAELQSGANRLAHFLRRRGVSVGDRVVVCVDRSADMLLTVLGVMKTGAAYVPLDPEFPRDRIAMVVEDVDPILIVTQSDIANRLEFPEPTTVCIDALKQEIDRESDVSPATAVTPDDIAYIIFTSGSTGKPKGVQIPHRAVVNFLTSMAHEPGLNESDALLAVTTLSFDIAVLELYLPLTVGGRVIIATRDDAIDGNRLLALMDSSQATVMQATPATWRLLLEAGWTGNKNLKVLCGGEALPRDLADALLARSAQVWNMYGPTETTVWSATSQILAGTEPVRVGPPIANTEFYVLDHAGKPVPIGVAGELHIGGEGLAIGYWNRPDLTAEKFIPDSFRPGPNRRLYKTGDLVRPCADGTLEFLGRADNQVKIRGFRIETGDVEHALKQYPGVRDCVVVARADVAGDKQLVGYVVTNGSQPAAGDFRRHLASLLPGYMVPSAFVLLDALPQTPNGKVDRKALPAPNRTTEEKSTGTPPRTAEEKILAEICSNILKQPAVFVDDNLFDLGADSLRLFQIVSRAKDKGLNLTIRQMLAGQTIAAVCSQIEKAAPAVTRPVLSAAKREQYRMPASNSTATSFDLGTE